MKETSFIHQNKEKWYKFEKMYQQNSKDPDELSRLFIELTDDLSYARTHYPKRSVRVYLNGLAQKVYNKMYRVQRESFSAFWKFWTVSLPLEMYRARTALLISFLVMGIGAVIGIISTLDDPNYLDTIAPGRVSYEEMCIAKDKPISVYQYQGETSMFFELVINNIRVAFLTFVMGVLGAIGTGFFLVYNGILLGTFITFYHTKGLLAVCMLTIWLHGSFEIPAIIIAGAAGFTFGTSMLFPGSMTRTQSMLLGAKRAIKIMVGVFPLLLIAGFIEAFVTRYGPDMPVWLNLVIIISLFSVVIFYFVIYPFIVARKHNFDPRLEEKPIFSEDRELTWFRIRTFGDIFNDTFVFYRKGFSLFGRVLLLNIFLCIVYGTYMFYYSQFGSFRLEWYEKMSLAFNTKIFFDPIGYVMLCGIFTLNVLAVYHAVITIKEGNNKEDDFGYWGSFFRFVGPNILPVFIMVAAIFIAWAFAPWFLLLFLIFVTPFLFNLSFPGIAEKKKLFPTLGRGFAIASKGYWSGVGLFCVFLLPAGLALFFPELVLDIFKTEVLDWFIASSSLDLDFVHNLVDGIYYLVVINLILPMFVLGFVFLYYSIIEKEEAFGLYQRLEKFGKHSKMYETK